MSRDTQFAGFADALVEELTDSNQETNFDSTEKFIANWKQIVARRAYSFAYHVLSTAEVDLCGATPGQLIASIPDMVEEKK